VKSYAAGLPGQPLIMVSGASHVDGFQHLQLVLPYLLALIAESEATAEHRSI
jgi:hypothetical protein